MDMAFLRIDRKGEYDMRNLKIDRLRGELERAREKAAEWQARARDLEKQVT